MLQVQHESGASFVVGGRSRPPADSHPGVSLKRAMKAAAPLALPPACSYASPAEKALGLMMLNNRLGCCVIAGAYHALGIWTGNGDGGQPFLASDANILADYEAIGGYRDGDPRTDNGCNQPDAFQWWMGLNGGRGFADGSLLSGYASVDGGDQTEMKTAIYTFESVTFGVELPADWVSKISGMQPGFVWDVAGPPVPHNGHDFIACGFNAEGVQIVTWGMVGTITWAAVAKYAVPSAGGAVYALLSREQIVRGQNATPIGIDWDTLLADLDALPDAIANAPSPVRRAASPRPERAASPRPERAAGSERATGARPSRPASPAPLPNPPAAPLHPAPRAYPDPGPKVTRAQRRIQELDAVMVIERDGFGFTARAERADGSVEVMTDAGESSCFDSFFPKAEAWASERGIPVPDRASVTPPEEE